jgi:hypothetical protein
MQILTSGSSFCGLVLAALFLAHFSANAEPQEEPRFLLVGVEKQHRERRPA